MTTEKRADEVVRGLYRNLPDGYLADMLHANRRDYDQSEPSVKLMTKALTREMDRRSQGAA